MTDDIETDVSSKTNISKRKHGRSSNQIIEYTDEELEFLLGPKDVMIEMKCKSCGLEEEVPEWVLEEFLEEEILNGETKRVYSCMCPRCNKAMYRK